VIHRLCLLLVLPLALLSACDNTAEPVFHDQYLAFGTLIEVTFYGVEHAYAETVSAEIEQQPFTPEPALLPLLAEANRLSRLSNHLFNPTIGKLIAAWGFQGNPLPEGTYPDPATIEQWLAQAPTVDDVSIQGTQIVSRNPQLAYDLGAFAKGYAIDRLIDHLRKRGIHNAIVNTGGDLRAIGARGERAWNIGIRHPRREGILARIQTSGDTSVFTSGDYERLFEADGKRFHHILDPRTGYPATGTSAVTVVHENAATADAAATALFVAGADDWQAIARRMGIDRVMRVDGAGVIHMTPAMQAITELNEDINAEVRITH
jgi:thiamine biosynthesis lipoprotein